MVSYPINKTFAFALSVSILLFPALIHAADGKSLTLEYCQACHLFTGTNQAGTVAPPLAGMKQRFKDRQQLISIIEDPAKALNKDTMMPPFGKNHLLDQQEISLIVDYLYTL